MPLDSSFRHASRILKDSQPIKKVRRVRDPAYWDAPYGTPITAAMKEAKRAQKTGQKARGAASPARGGAGGGKGGDKTPKAPAGASGGGGREYQSRLAEYDKAIAAAKGENDLIKVVDRVQNDSLLNTADYDRVLDAVENKFAGGEHKPLAKPRKVRAPKKVAPAKKPAPKEEKKPPTRTDYGELKGSDGKPILPPKPKAPAAPGQQHRHQSFIDRAVADGKQFDLYKNGVKQPGGPWKVTGGRRNGYIRVVGKDGVGVDVDKEQLKDHTPSAPKSDPGAKIAENLIANAKNATNEDILNHLVDRATKNQKAGKIDRVQQIAVLVAVGNRREELNKPKVNPKGKALQRGKPSMAQRIKQTVTGDTRGGQKTEVPKLGKNDADNLKRLIAEQDDVGELEQIKADLNQLGHAQQRRELKGLADARIREISNQSEVRPGLDRNATPETQAKKVETFRKRIDAARNEEDLMDVVERVEADGTIDQEAAAAIFDAVSQKFKSIQQSQKKRPARDQWPGKRVVRDDGDDIEQAQAKHFAKKSGGIGNAPAAGLWNHVRANPDRFSVVQNGDKGISDNYWVTDNGKKPPETWMFKQAFFDGKAGPDVQDIFNEQMAAEILKGAGFDMPDTKWASSANGNPQYMAQRHYAEQFGMDKVLKNSAHISHTNGFQPATIEKIQKGSDPDAPMRLAIFDYLINNSPDRHRNNFLLLEEKDGNMRLGIIDQGLAFKAGEISEGFGPKTPLDRFLGRYRAFDNRGGWALDKVLAAVHGKDRDDAGVALDRAIEGFEKVDTDKIRAALHKQTKLSRQQEELMEKWLGAFEWRRDWLRQNRDAALKHITDYGGFY